MGQDADALYIVVSGRFSVEVSECDDPVAEIGSGATIGEIAFFAGGPRTATCRAVRDSVVLRLTRSDFDVISKAYPDVWPAITASLAERLAAETRKSAALKGRRLPRPRPRTITIVPAGPVPVDPAVLQALCEGLRRDRSILVIDSAGAPQVGLDASSGELDMASALNALEERVRTVVYVADADLTAWSRVAIRQADDILLVGSTSQIRAIEPVPRNALEAYSFALERRPHHRLVLCHDRRGNVRGTRFWLEQRPVLTHHHLTAGDADSIARMWRFAFGQARGFVACGGGAYCAAHIGLYDALRQASFDLDVFGGSSGGAAMAAAFAQDLPPQEISERVQAMFIDGRAMQRYTVPRYGLLDHAHFDAHLKGLYNDTMIEDLWKPFFAVAFDLTNVAVAVLTTGPVWSAIRASAAIPGLLPPFIDASGNLLIDGSVSANVPIDIMHQLKSGPNVVVSFDKPLGERMQAGYDSLPGRGEILRHMLNPWTRRAMPAIPGAATVLVRALMANRNHFEAHLERDDWLLMPPILPGLGPLDWSQHRKLTAMAFAYAREELAKRRPAWSEISAAAQ